MTGDDDDPFGVGQDVVAAAAAGKRTFGRS